MATSDNNYNALLEAFKSYIELNRDHRIQDAESTQKLTELGKIVLSSLSRTQSSLDDLLNFLEERENVIRVRATGDDSLRQFIDDLENQRKP